MRIERSTHLPITAQQCFAQVRMPRLLLHVASPIVKFLPIEPSRFPERWEQAEYLVAVRLFGFVPMGRQQICISWQDRSPEFGRFHVEVRDNGHGSLASRWDHLISIEAEGAGCRYTDTVDIEAGAFTPMTWLFAWFFYRHRQRRWQGLAARGGVS